jgi:deoxyhypusine synthase
MSKYIEFDFSGLKKYKVADRNSKVNIDEFAKVSNTNISGFLDGIPDILKGREIKELIDKTYTAYKAQKPIIIGIGGHVIKTGMSPLLIEMMRLGAIQGICCNGSVVIHDFEIACFGQTSENVSEALEDGSFGMATDTCDTLNEIIAQAYKDGLGYGEAVGKFLSEREILHPELSLLKNAYEMNIPVTVHVAVGTDIVHQHETANGVAIGDCSMRDFRIFTHMVSELGDGGVFINFGSAVIIPEVFLKALTVCRNKGFGVKNITTAVFDMNTHYRPETNIVSRPVKSGGKGYYFVGHHEIMMPLFWFGVRERIMG